MTSDEFGKVYERAYPRALAVLTRHCSRADAEDAIGAATLYFMGRLGAYNCITTSLFIQMAVQRARHIFDRDHRKYERLVGSINDLADLEGPEPNNGA